MRYRLVMASLASAFAASIVALTVAVPAVGHATLRGPGSGAAAVRYDWGSSARFEARARIMNSASVGAGLAPPRPRLVPRRTTVSASNGRPVVALVYDLE